MFVAAASSPEFTDRISLGQIIQIGQVTVLALAFLFRKYFGSETTAEQTKAHAALLASQAETVAKMTSSQNLQQALLEKIDRRLELIEKDFYVPVTRGGNAGIGGSGRRSTD